MTRSPAAVEVLDQARTALLDQRVEAGEVVARVGEAGPVGMRKAQVHFAIFAPVELGATVDPGYWRLIEGGTGRFCKVRSLIDLIDRPGPDGPSDGLLSRREILRFFKESEDRVELRRYVVHHPSEWTPGDWQTELAAAPDFAELSAGERRTLVDEQISPSLWWTRDVATHAGLPEDGLVYSYHPIGFLVWYEAIARRTAELRSSGIQVATAGTVRVGATDRFKLDAESSAFMTDLEDQQRGPVRQKMTLEELIRGYPE